MGSRIATWLGLAGLAGRRLAARATRTAPRQVAFTVTGVALPVALLLVVTSVSLGLAGGGTVASADADYWLVPEDGAGSAVVPVEGPRFGSVHAAASRLEARDDVAHATPVLLELVHFEAGGRSAWVLAVGVVPGEAPLDVAGVSTAALAPGDPHYADGGYDGPRTDEVVLSSGAAALLDVDAGAAVTASTRRAARPLTVVAVDAGAQGGELPVAVVHLAELQTLTGTAAGDAADQLLVHATAPSARAALAGVYPRSTVVERGGLGAGRVLDDDLATAVAAAALAVALVVGALSAATAMGLAVAASSADRAVLSAVGFSARSRAGLLAVETLALALAGGVLGVAGWLAAVPLANRVAARYVADTTVARVHPELAAYGLAAALAIGLLVLPYLLVVGRRTTTVEALVE